MKLTNPYANIRSTDPKDVYRLNCDISLADARAIRNVLIEYGIIQTLVNNFVHALADECRLLSIDDSEYVLQRCAEGIPFRRSGEDERPRPRPLGRVGNGKIQKG